MTPQGDGDEVDVRLAVQRTFKLIRVDEVEVMSSRARGKEQFKANVRSIGDNGLYKPIVVNAREREATGRYRLICGEGRLAAHRELRRELIKAEIVNVDEATAHIMALGENLTKCAPQAIEYAYALQEMNRQGSSLAEMERITGHPGQYIKAYIRLVEQGEDRLIKGVELGIFTLEFAMRVAETPDGAIQHLLMDAFDSKLITAKQVEPVRKILMARSRQGGALTKGAASAANHQDYSITDLKRDIARVAKEKQSVIHAAEGKETRLITLLDSLRRLREDAELATLLKRHDLDHLPDLQGTYGL